jgi:hypothetical protein
MNNAEKYATTLVCITLVSTVLFFSALIYIENYHVIERTKYTTVSRGEDGQYLAVLSNTLFDNYPYLQKKILLDIENTTFTDSNVNTVLSWAITNTDDNTVYLSSSAIPFDGSIVHFPSGTYVLGKP